VTWPGVDDVGGIALVVVVGDVVLDVVDDVGSVALIVDEAVVAKSNPGGGH